MKRIPYFNILSSVLFAGYFWYCLFTPTTWHFIDGVNLIFHEAGHAICFFLPSILVAIAGSGFQILVPLICALSFYRTKQYVSALLILFWAAENVMSVALYMQDAIPMQLPLLGGDSSIHDWNFIFSDLGLLSKSPQIAFFFILLSYTITVVSSVVLIKQIVRESAHAEAN